MSRICRTMGDSGKVRFYELDHESKMRLLKTHSHTSNGLAMEPGTREEKQLKETQTPQQGKSHPSKTCRVPPVWRGGAKKALEPAAYRRCGGGGRKGSTANQSQKRYFFFFFFSHTFTLQLLNKPWSQVSSLLRPGSCLQF